MTPYEILRHNARLVLPALHSRAHRDLRRLITRAATPSPSVLDVGGRSSPYTIALPARITVMDIPREAEVQEDLHLGMTDPIFERLTRRRSNVEDVLIEDMCTSTLPDNSRDGIVAVEVIEHIDQDEAFVRQIARVLRPGAWAYFTTPNGDYIKNEPPNYNPDHVRHYRREELQSLLERHFALVEVVYGIRTGRHRWRGLRSISYRKPLQAIGTMVSNVMSARESMKDDNQPQRTAHLFAIAYKGGAEEP